MSMTPVGPPCQPHSYRHRCPDKKRLLEQHYALEHGLSVDLSPVYRQRGVAESVTMYAGPYSHLNTARTHGVNVQNRAMNPQASPTPNMRKLVHGFPSPAGAWNLRQRSGPEGPSFSRLTRERSLLRAMPHPSGAASALSETATELGGALLGIAVLGGLGPIGYRATLGDAATDGVPGRPTRLAALWSSLGTSRGRPRRGSSTARAMLCSTDSGAAAPASAAIGRRDGGRCRAALVDRARSRGQRPSVLCEIRSQPWIV